MSGATAREQHDPWYHLGCDDLFNLSRPALEQMADAAVHATITLAQSSDLPAGAAQRVAAGRAAVRAARGFRCRNPTDAER